jgi:hypothetical protein
MVSSNFQLAHTERRIRRLAIVIASLSVVVYPLLLRNWVSVLAVVLGAALAWLNFHWLSAGVEAMLRPANPKKIKFLVAKFLLRLLLIFAALYAMIRVSLEMAGGLLLGLSVYILAIMAEAFFSVFSSAKK